MFWFGRMCGCLNGWDLPRQALQFVILDRFAHVTRRGCSLFNTFHTANLLEQCIGSLARGFIPLPQAEDEAD